MIERNEILNPLQNFKPPLEKAVPSCSLGSLEPLSEKKESHSHQGTKHTKFHKEKSLRALSATSAYE
jgi:hypothetical protein